MIDPDRLRDRLRARGVPVLHVSDSPDPGTLLVYIQGGDDGRARRLCRAVPGVLDAVDSEQSCSIIRVTLGEGPR